MAPDRGRNRASEFEDILVVAPRDFDPEVDGEQNGCGDDNGSSADDGAGAREHYSEVEKSKLRKPREAALGPQYRGSRVSRDTVAEDDEDDPFETFEDVESDVESQSSDVDSVDEDQDEDGETSDTDMSVDEEPSGPLLSKTQPNRRELLKAVAHDQKAVASSLANSMKADAEKGRAVKKQKTTFDSLLNTRIKLQKSLVATNSLPGLQTSDSQVQPREQQAVIEAAETAAFKLWSSLNSLRNDLIAQRAGEKRKRDSFSSSSSSVSLWHHMQAQEERSLPHRNATLQRWSNKVRNANVVPERGIINKAAQQTTIVDALNEHLSNRDRLIKRTQTPRSCAPIQHAAGVVEDSKIYDDADFYGILLKELLEQKNADSVTAANVDINFNLKRETKAKKNVDTKASKGRKLRYTVHEKLQNFMAPEDRGTWSERQADELFRSLFGNRGGLGEELQENEAGEAGEGVGDDGFVLFRP